MADQSTPPRPVADRSRITEPRQSTQVPKTSNTSARRESASTEAILGQRPTTCVDAKVIVGPLSWFKLSIEARPTAAGAQTDCSAELLAETGDAFIFHVMQPTGRSRGYLDTLRERVLVFDGSMGANLQELNLTAEDFGGPAYEGCMDALCVTRPEFPARLHQGFLEVGCDVVETNTFQASRLRLTEWGLGERTFEINYAGARLARQECDAFESLDGRPRFVAGSIGPSGLLPGSDDPTLSNISFPQLVEVFAEQAEALISGGADLLIVETQQDILETKAVVHGARRAFAKLGRRVPLQIQVTLDVNGRMLLGTDVGAMLSILEALGADIIGLNCSTGPEHMREP